MSSQADYDSAQAQYDQAVAKVEESQRAHQQEDDPRPVFGRSWHPRGQPRTIPSGGAQVAPLQSLDPIYVNFWLPQQNLGQIGAGQLVSVQADGLPNVTFDGTINAVDAVVDEATRNVRVQATLSNPNALLRPGMFVNTEVPLASKSNHVVLPATAVQYAPYGDMVYIIEDLKGPDGKTISREYASKLSGRRVTGRPCRHPFWRQCRRGSRDLRGLQAASRRSCPS